MPDDDLAREVDDTEEPAYVTFLWDPNLEEWEMHTKMERDEVVACLSWVLMKMAAGEWDWEGCGS